MRNITVSLDDELYRKSRVAAAEADTSVTALVREFLTLLTGADRRSSGKAAATDSILEIIDSIRERHPDFDPENRLARDEIHMR